MTDRQKQHLLGFLGYDTGGVDGILGAKTRNAIESVQEDLGIPADGVWGPQTETAVLEAVYTYDVDAPAEQDPDKEDEALAARFKGIRYWSAEEFRCQCGGKYCNGFPALPDRTLLELADDLREAAGAPGHRSSGLRCQTHNDLQPGSVPDSRHIRGKALDFMLENKTGKQLLAMAQADPRCRYAYIIGSGPYVHVDVE